MRFLADENFPRAAVAAVSQAGFEIVSVAQTAGGMRDADLLAWAAREGRIILTFDKDFGELARASGSRSFGVILFRIPMPRSADVGRELVDRICPRGDWMGHFSVVEAGRIRMRPLGQTG